MIKGHFLSDIDIKKHNNRQAFETLRTHRAFLGDDMKMTKIH